ncbi:hypothetical protein MIDIC_230151 [Alphaproteobacteria bacterium]
MKKYNEIYQHFSGLLLEFMLSTYLPSEERDDRKTIIKFIEENEGYNRIQTTIIQGKEILELEPFPHEWIGDTADRLVYDADKKEWVDDPMLYKEWTRWIVDTLEEEARKAGKL